MESQGMDGAAAEPERISERAPDLAQPLERG
jgi:hypothetical protein